MQVPLDPGASGRTRVRADEDLHIGERVGYVDQGADTLQAGRMSEMDQIDEASHAGVKGEFVRNSVPPDGMMMKTR